MDTFGPTTNKVNFVPLDIKNDPYEVFEFLYPNHDDIFILESLTGPKEMAELSIIGFDPILKITVHNNKLELKSIEGSIERYELEEPLSKLKEIMPRINDDRYRYIGGAVGYVSYDSINYWEDIHVKVSDYPSMEFGIYTDGILFDHNTNKVYYFYLNKSRLKDLKFDKCYERVEINNIKRRINIERFKKMVEMAKHYIYEGDVYQVVLSKRIDLDIKGNRLMVYSHLRAINPSPYMYMLKSKDIEIIGSSPEMLVRVVNKRIETFPIAGTRAIGKSKEEKDRLRKEMLNDEKELAEHTMLVDLARNDLGRVCRWGSVKVNELMSVKEFSHVQHIVSHVVGELRSDKDCYDSLKAVFPAGTVSGAPKIRAMEIIDMLEEDARGPYAGAIGYFSFNGSSDFAITIRSLFINKDKAYIQSGAGIVADSDPEREWYETEYKAQVLLDTLKRCIEC